MFGIFDKIEEFFKELLLGGIQANLESMFLDINDKVGAVATDVGKTPMGWNGDVFAFIKSINDSVIIPIAGLIITAVLCIELINMVMTIPELRAKVLSSLWLEVVLSLSDLSSFHYLRVYSIKKKRRA